MYIYIYVRFLFKNKKHMSAPESGGTVERSYKFRGSAFFFSLLRRWNPKVSPA